MSEEFAQSPEGTPVRGLMFSITPEPATTESLLGIPERSVGAPVDGPKFPVESPISTSSSRAGGGWVGACDGPWSFWFSKTDCPWPWEGDILWADGAGVLRWRWDSRIGQEGPGWDGGFDTYRFAPPGAPM